MPLSLPSLVDVAALSEHLQDSSLRLFDATVELVRPPEGGPYTVRSGRPGYERAHIPGAAFADHRRRAVGSRLAVSRSRCPSAGAVRDGCRPARHRAGTHVVAYAQDAPMWATRLWWQLRFFGFDAVSVLDGGLPAWRAAGLPTESGARVLPAGGVHRAAPLGSGSPRAPTSRPWWRRATGLPAWSTR